MGTYCLVRDDRGLHGPDFSTHFFFAWPGQLEKSPVICQPGPARWKNHLSFAARIFGKIISHLPARPDRGPSTGLTSDSGPCRPLSQLFVKSCARKAKTIIPLFIANAFLHNWMTHVNFILFIVQWKHIKIYFKIFHPLTVIY